MALYPKATIRLLPLGPQDPPIKARVAILHVADSQATTLYDWFNGPSQGVEAHFYIRYDGTVEQYRDTAFQADANMLANDFAISIETQGLAAGVWTEPQLIAIKALLLWLRNTHNIPLVQCPYWNGSGVGYHILFEDAWDQRHASCPGPNRIVQFAQVIVPWMKAQQASASSIPVIFHKIVQKVTKALRPKTPVVPAFPGTVRQGSRGDAVRKVQQRLKDRGWPITVDGDFGSGTDKTVRAFQAEKGLAVDGVVGPNTWRALWTTAVTK